MQGALITKYGMCHVQKDWNPKHGSHNLAEGPAVRVYSANGVEPQHHMETVSKAEKKEHNKDSNGNESAK